jgi:DNA-binding MarR family transcriptional regulator
MGFRMSLSSQELRELGAGHLGRLLLHALRRVQATSLGKLQERGHPAVRTGHIPVFSGVAQGGARITDLAVAAGMTRQMMGRLVRELEEEGYVCSHPDPHDQRAVVVELTDRGVAFCADAQEVMSELEAAYAELLGGDGLAQLRTALIRLAAER